jgi:hypothetical protein
MLELELICSSPGGKDRVDRILFHRGYKADEAQSMNKIILADSQAIFRAGTAKVLAMTGGSASTTGTPAGGVKRKVSGGKPERWLLRR